MLKSIVRRVAAALGLSLLLGAMPAQARAPHSGRPALWEVSDPDTTIYLFGTIHLLPDNFQWRTAKFDQAMAGSQQLVVETIVDEKNPQRLMQAMASLAFAKGLPPLTERVPPAKRAALEAAVKKNGTPLAVLNQMKTWAAAFVLLRDRFAEIGLKGGQGVEAVLRNSFAGAGKPVGELESNVEQLGYFDRLPEAAQVALLEGAIDQTQAVNEDFAGMLRAWSSGDVAGIAKNFDRDLAASPTLSDALIRQRNANWSRWIERRLAQPGAVMIAVGAGHLAGKNSVLEMLKRGGYKVRRLQ